MDKLSVCVLNCSDACVVKQTVSECSYDSARCTFSTPNDFQCNRVRCRREKSHPNLLFY